MLTPTRLRKELRGVIAFAPTPFGPDGSVDLDGIAAIVDELADYGGPVAVCGAVGEYASLTYAERNDVARVAGQVVRDRVPLIVGIGDASPTGARSAEAAAKAGAAGILVNPVSFSPPSPDGLVAHAQGLAAASGLGLIAFSTTGAVLSLELLLRLAEVDAVVALKDEWGDLRLFAEAQDRIGQRWAWINGMAELQAAEYAALGADAFTSGLINVAPELTLSVRDAVLAGDRATLRSLASRIRPFAALRARRPGYSTAVIKEAMSMRGRPGGGRVRPPISPVSAEDRDEVRAVLAAMGEPARD